MPTSETVRRTVWYCEVCYAEYSCSDGAACCERGHIHDLSAVRKQRERADERCRDCTATHPTPQWERDNAEFCRLDRLIRNTEAFIARQTAAQEPMP